MVHVRIKSVVLKITWSVVSNLTRVLSLEKHFPPLAETYKITEVEIDYADIYHQSQKLDSWHCKIGLVSQK